MNSWIYFPLGLIFGFVVCFAIGLAARWLYSQLKQTIGGMYDSGESLTADQGDDWTPFPWLGRSIKAAQTRVWVIPQRQPLIEVVIDQTRPAWHSSVGVELAGREVSK